MVLPAHGVKMGPKVLKVAEVLMEIQVLLVLLGKRENSEFQGSQVIREGKVQRVQLDSQDSQEPTARRVEGVRLANQVQGGNEVQRVHAVKEVRGAALESLALRATLVVMGPLVLLAKGDRQDLKDQLDFLDQKAPLVHQGRMDCLVTPDREVKLVSKARQVLQALQVLLARRVLLERRVQWVSVGIQVHRVHQVSRVYLAWLERKEPRVTRDLPAFQEKTAPLAYGASRVKEVSLAQLELLG